MEEELDHIILSRGLGLVNGKIEFPDYVSRLKFDVGLSKDAVQSLHWLRTDPELAVIGFEPLEENISAVLQIIDKEDRSLNLSERFVILPIALADFEGEHEFYVTDDDAGSSSLFKPVSHKLKSVTKVRTTTLEKILRYVDLEKYKRIDFLKTDCQGADFRVILGASDLITKFAVVTVEADTQSYEDSDDNSDNNFDKYMTSHGFLRINPRAELRKEIGKAFSKSKIVDRLYRLFKTQFPVVHSQYPRLEVDDPTYINQLDLEKIKNGEVTAYQRG